MKNTIEFYSDIQGVADAYPIVKPTDVLPNWISMVREDYKQSDKSQSHLYRCPGIFDLFSFILLHFLYIYNLYMLLLVKVWEN